MIGEFILFIYKILLYLKNHIDIKENELLREYPEVLEKLLEDHTTKKNIIWATDNYEKLDELDK